MKKLILLLSALIHAGVALAIPAYPGELQARQPDGSTLTIRLVGDEYLHFTTTDDGYTVVQNAEGWYVYAEKRDGQLVATDRKAHDEPARSAAETAWLESIGKRLAPQMREHSRQMKQMNLELQSEARSRARSRAGSRGNYDYNNFKGLVILVQYNDCKFTRSDYLTLVDNLMNQENYKGYDDSMLGRYTGSVRDYFSDNSNGLFKPEFDVKGPVTVNYSMLDAHDDDGSSHKIRPMISDVLDAVDSEVDFSEYDGDGNGEVDMVYFIFAGCGSHDGNDNRLLWAHSSTISKKNAKTGSLEKIAKDGVTFGRYACSTELAGGSDNSYIDGIGTICHEFSHVLGLPDLYDTDYEKSNGESNHPGFWSLMASGSRLNYSRTPAGYSLYERYAAGFATPELLTGEACYQLKPIGESNRGFRINSGQDKEFFLLENRQLSSKWDAYLPGHGLLVYRVENLSADVWKLTNVDNKNKVNADPYHNYYELVRAGGGWGDKESDPFPGTQHVRRLTNKTLPANLLSWTGKASPLVIDDIQEREGIISFNLTEESKLGGDDKPAITPESYAVNYWFDDMKELKGHVDNPAAEFSLDVSSLSDGLHALHIAIAEVTTEGDYIESSPCTVYFEKHGQETEVMANVLVDYSQLTSFRQNTTSNSKLTIPLTGVDEGLHQVTTLIGLTGSDDSYTIASAFFQRVPTDEELEDQHLSVSIDGVVPTTLKRAFEDNTLTYELDVHEMPAGLHDLTCEIKGFLSLSPYREFFVIDPRENDYVLAVSIDGVAPTTLDRGFEDGKLEYNLDVHEMQPGLHDLTYHVKGMVIMPPMKDFFVIDPKLDSYEYWLNEDLSTAVATTGLNAKGAYNLNTKLPVRQMPLRSDKFYFNVEEGIPVTYAINDFTMKVISENGAEEKSPTVSYIDESSRTPVGSNPLAENKQTKVSISSRGITWMYLKAKTDDVIGLQASQSCSIQLFSPSGEEIINATGTMATKKNSITAPANGTYYVAIHDLANGSAVSVNYTLTLGKNAGDVNSDGKIDSVDIELVADFIMGKKHKGIDKDKVDINRDGMVNAVDLTAIVNLMLHGSITPRNK